MTRNHNDRNVYVVVIGLALAAVILIQTTRFVRIGMPGSMLSSGLVGSSQSEPGSDTPRSYPAGDSLTQLSQSSRQ